VGLNGKDLFLININFVLTNLFTKPIMSILLRPVGLYIN